MLRGSAPRDSRRSSTDLARINESQWLKRAGPLRSVCPVMRRLTTPRYCASELMNAASAAALARARCALFSLNGSAVVKCTVLVTYCVTVGVTAATGEGGTAGEATVQALAGVGASEVLAAIGGTGCASVATAGGGGGICTGANSGSGLSAGNR